MQGVSEVEESELWLLLCQNFSPKHLIKNVNAFSEFLNMITLSIFFFCRGLFLAFPLKILMWFLLLNKGTSKGKK